MPPLPLDDPRWGTLEHAFGPASDVPAQLRALAEGDDQRGGEHARDELLWTLLCHQGTIYTATYAAVPHIVAIGSARPASEQIHFWIFVGAVADSHDAAPVPEDLRDAYDAAVRQALELATACFVPGLGESDAPWLAVAVAGLRRQPAIADAVEGICDGWQTPSCPACARDLYVMLDPLPFVVHDDDPIRGDGGNTSDVRTVDPRPEIADLARLVRQAGLDELATTILALDAQATCPACGHSFNVIDVCGIA